MTSAIAVLIPSRLSLSVVALRRHAALVRALLEELERIAPAVGGSSDGDVVAEQLIEELTHLGRRILDCVETMNQTPAKSDDADLPGPRFARATSSRFKPAPPMPGAE